MFKRIQYQHVLYAALVATVFSALYLKLTELFSSGEEVIEIVSPIARQSPTALQEKVIQRQWTNASDGLDQLLLSETNIFPVRNKIEASNPVTTEVAPVKHVFVAPPPPQNPAANIPPPVIQPPPFKYLGKLLGDDEYQVFLSFQNKNYVLKVGDVIQDMYKVEKIQPPILALNNISSNTLQEINIGE